MASNLRFVLNGARSPVNKLPPVVLSQIFAYLRIPGTLSRGYPLERIREISNGSLATVNLVCRYWRQTVIGAKELTGALTATIADPNRELKEWPRTVTGSDFETMRVLRKESTGKVFLVRHKATSDLFALKEIGNKCRYTLEERQQTYTEQAVLWWMATERKFSFVVKLWWSFPDHERLSLVMDFHPGGDLATQLARWGRFGHDRALFYAAEIVEGVEGLHKNGIVYRNLQPANVLIDSNGHIVLTDFGLSDTSIDRPNVIQRTETVDTSCGTAEYLAPEVIQGLPHSFKVDWWSFGTMLYEMLTGTVWTLSGPLGKIRPLITLYRPPSGLTTTLIRIRGCFRVNYSSQTIP